MTNRLLYSTGMATISDICGVALWWMRSCYWAISLCRKPATLTQSNTVLRVVQTMHSEPSFTFTIWMTQMQLHSSQCIFFYIFLGVVIWVSVKHLETICIVIDAIQIKLNWIEFYQWKSPLFRELQNVCQYDRLRDEIKLVSALWMRGDREQQRGFVEHKLLLTRLSCLSKSTE